MKFLKLSVIIIFQIYCETSLHSLSHHFRNKKEYLTFKLNTPIQGCGLSTEELLYNFTISHNKNIDHDILKYIIKTYISESKIEYINHDISFAQMLLETNFLKFGNTVYSLQNNFAGLGVISNDIQGNSFQAIYLGIRAHIQHLISYSSFRKVRKVLVDKRFHLVKRGSAMVLNNLSGRWATDPQYSKKIYNLIIKLLYPHHYKDKIYKIKK